MLNSDVIKNIQRAQMTVEELSTDLATPEEAATLLHQSKSTIYNWLCERRLRKVKLGRRVFVRKSEILEILQNAIDG